jgi:hypothetical protein
VPVRQGSERYLGVDRSAVEPYFKVEMGSCGPTARAGTSYYLACVYAISRANHYFAQVCIASLDAEPVIHEHGLAVTAGPLRMSDDPGTGRQDRGTAFGAKIEALMDATPTAERVEAGAEAGGDLPLDRLHFQRWHDGKGRRDDG